MPTNSRFSARDRFGTILHRHAALCGYLVGLFGWVVAVPLYGSVGRAWVAARGGDFAHLPLWWLGAHAPALVLFGLLWDRRPAAARAGAQAAALINGALTLLMFGLPAPLRPWLFALMGISTAAGMTAWGKWYASTVDAAWLGRVFGLAAAGVSLVNWAFDVVARAMPPDGALLVTLVPLVPAWWAARRVDTAVHPTRSTPAASAVQARVKVRTVVHLGLFIIFFSVVAGLSYQVLVAAPLTPFVDESLRRLPYLVSVLSAGAVADRRSLQSVLVAGAGLLAAAFLVGAWGDAAAQYLSTGLNGAAFGLLEGAPWLLLASLATPDTAGRWFGWGLNLNVVPIAFGALVSLPLEGLSPEHVSLLATAVILLGILSLHGVTDPLTLLHRWKSPPAEAAPAGSAEGGVPAALRSTVPELLAQQFGSRLSTRELEVAQLAVLGVATRDIAQQLYISENTVKTHLKNVYAKTGTANRNDLYRRLVEAETASLVSGV